MSQTQTSRVTRGGLLCLTLHTEVVVEADEYRIWEVLTDFSRYGEWNACIPFARGKAEEGHLLQVEIHWPGLKRSAYTLLVLAANPERELRWLGHFGISGLMDGDHTFKIEPLGAGRCKVIQIERFTGWLVPIFTPWLRKNVLDGFELMNTALKTRAESA